MSIQTPDEVCDEVVGSAEYVEFAKLCMQTIRLGRQSVCLDGFPLVPVQAVARELRRKGWKVSFWTCNENYSDYMSISWR